MNRTEYLLVKLMEECDELSQRAAKALIFGVNEIQVGQLLNNSERMNYEYNDLLAIANMLAGEDIMLFPDWDYIRKKQDKVEKWMEHSRKRGCLK